MESRSITLSRSRSPRRYRNSRSVSRSSKRTLSLTRSSSKILIEKLTRNVTTAHIQEIFSSYGEIKTIDMPMNRRLNTNRGLCYIVYETSNSANAAVSHMHEGQIDGSVISVSIISPRPFNNRKSSFSPGRLIVVIVVVVEDILVKEVALEEEATLTDVVIHVEVTLDQEYA
ncbi:hypothetical protein PCK1_002007 [Pneumocystis canis]|nr:hypothetical protein PCK1_002007 [Pneumocystis canis]